VITSPAAKDRDWLPVAAAEQWVVITRDRNILDHLSLLEAVKAHGVRLVTVDGAEGAEKWGQLEIVMTQWRRLETLHAYWSDRVAKGDNATAREVSLACETTIHAARAAVRRYKSGVIPMQIPILA
jgi:PIN like domain